MAEQRKLEFYLQIFFATYPLNPQRTNNSRSLTQEMSHFKQYIETTVSHDPLLSQTSEFVTYYALPYVPNPLDHKSFKHLFTPQFQQQLLHKVTAFLDANHKRSLHSIDSHHGEFHSSRLEQLYRESSQEQSPAAALENQKLRRVIEEMQAKIVEAYEKQTQIEGLIADIDSSLAFEISKILGVPHHAGGGIKRSLGSAGNYPLQGRNSSQGGTQHHHMR